MQQEEEEDSRDVDDEDTEFLSQMISLQADIMAKKGRETLMRMTRGKRRKDDGVKEEEDDKEKKKKKAKTEEGKRRPVSPANSEGTLSDCRWVDLPSF